jgi:voltage-dependent potassium channel beta subunit
MNYRRLGKAGIQLSELSLGSWVTFGSQIGDDMAQKLMKTAYDNGINFFDNAESYAGLKSEYVMGYLLKQFGWDRTSYVISSKVFWGGKLPNQTGLSRKHIVEACHGALQRFQTDYLDLFFCHRPDPNTPIEETVAAMTDLVRQGKILYWGTSEWSAAQIQQAYDIAKTNYLVAPTMEQPQYNLLHRERFETEYAPLYDHAGVGLGTTIWSPLASGLLTGKYIDTHPDSTRTSRPGMEWLKEQFTADDQRWRHNAVLQLQTIAKDLNLTMASLALAWCLKNQNVSTVILGATKEEQLLENLKAIDAVALITDDIMSSLNAIAQ